MLGLGHISQVGITDLDHQALSALDLEKNDATGSRRGSSVRASEGTGDSALSLLSKLVEQQGQALKDLANRMDLLAPKVTQNPQLIWQ